jgi:peptidyl-dipeptidase A
MSDPSAVVHELDELLRPMEIALADAWWEVNTASTPDADRRRAEQELARRALLADPERYERVKAALHDSSEPIERRVLTVVANAMAANQVREELRTRLVALETSVESTFVNHRGTIDGREVSDNDIEVILTKSDDVAERRKAWEASKSVGAAVAADLLELVRTRNEIASELGAPNHYPLALQLDELDEARLFRTLDEVEQLTNEPFRAWKAELDGRLAERFGCTIDDLRPWHYDDPFFQEAPTASRPNLDEIFAGADLEALTTRSYQGIGLDIGPALEGSDLYARPGKSQHAFCIAIDRVRDVRVLCNNVANERWMSTMLHEFGHATYDLEVDPALPFLIRQYPHLLATEAIALLFGRLTNDAEWLARVAGVHEAEAKQLDAELRAAQAGFMVLFARWVLVVCHFERGLYADPDADHGTRWWDLVERFQLVHRPDDGPALATGWASKVHLATAPVYYQNYLYGELAASQIVAALRRDVGGLVDRPEAGAWLRERVFRPGGSKRWDQLIEDATGEPLTARHFADQFVT